jgi:hypothetical protein
MDLWDLTKLMFRRWYVTAPLVLATLGALIWIAQTTEPDYVATGHVAVIPPEVHRVATAGEAVRSSPWNEEALAHASQIRLEGKRLLEETAETGLQGGWTVTVSGRLPVITLEVVASSPEQAIATLHHLQDVIAEEVRHRQEEYAVPADEQIRTVRYDTGESIETSLGGLRRALVAATGAGAILTVAVVMVFDALARRRQRRHPGGEAAGIPLGTLPAPARPRSPSAGSRSPWSPPPNGSDQPTRRVGGDQQAGEDPSVTRHAEAGDSRGGSDTRREKSTKARPR